MTARTLLTFQADPTQSPKLVQDTAANKWIAHTLEPYNSISTAKTLRNRVCTLQLPGGFGLVATPAVKVADFEQSNCRVWLVDHNNVAMRAYTVPRNSSDVPEYPHALRIAEAQRDPHIFRNRYTALEWFTETFAEGAHTTVALEPERAFGELAGSCWRDQHGIIKGSKLRCSLDRMTDSRHRLTLLFQPGEGDKAASLTLTASTNTASVWKFHYFSPLGAGPLGAKNLYGLVWAHWSHSDMSVNLPASLMGDMVLENPLKYVDRVADIDPQWMEALCATNGYLNWSAAIINDSRTADDAAAALQDLRGPVTANTIHTTVRRVREAALTADALVAAADQQAWQAKTLAEWVEGGPQQ